VAPVRYIQGEMRAQTKNLVVGTAWVTAGVTLLYLATRGPKYAFGGPNTATLNRDPRMLLPSFVARLNLLFARMRALGWDPYLNEGYRTPERAAELAKDGSGIVDSMHSYGAAADIRSESAGWSNPQFFVDLGRESEALGLTWGGHWGDANHVQAVSVADQPGLRVAGSKTWALADKFVQQHMPRAA